MIVESTIILMHMREDPELSAKTGISFLQIAEMKNKENLSKEKIIFEKKNDFCATGIIGIDGKTRIWILLHSNQPKSAWSSGDNFELTKQELLSITARCDVSTNALALLITHLINIGQSNPISAQGGQCSSAEPCSTR